MTITSKSANKDSTSNKKLDSTSGANNKKNKDNQQLVSNKVSKNDTGKSGDSSSINSKTSITNSNNNNNTTEADKYKRFENEGVVFKAKLIGSELVIEPRGDKMCQNSIQRLKAIIKGTNSHKKRIILKISYDGVKVYDEKTNEILHHHEVSQISYIASDDTDTRTFGFVSDVPNKAHQFICFKTSGPAINVMSVISDLFEAVLEKKNKAEKKESAGDSTSGSTSGNNDNNLGITKIIDDVDSGVQEQTIDLIGDSGIIDGGDISIIDNDISRLSSSQIGAATTNLSTSISNTNPLNTSQIHKTLQSSLSILENNITWPSPGNSFNSQQHFNQSLNQSVNQQQQQQNSLGKIGKQSTMSNDLIFDDLFAGLSDPIIVDKNDSLIINKSQQQQQQQQQQHQLQANQQQQQQQHPPAPFPIPIRRGQQHSVLLPPPSSLPKPPSMMGQQAGNGPSHNRSLVYNHSSLSLSDAALTRQSSFTSNAHNDSSNSYADRYAVFNDIDSLPSIFESTSLGGSVNKINQQQQQQQPQQHQLLPTPPMQPLSAQINNNNNLNFNNNNNTQPNNYFSGGASFGGTGISSNNGFNTINSVGPSFGVAGSGVDAQMGSGTIFQQQQQQPQSNSSINIDQTNNNNNNKLNMLQRQQTNPFDDDFFA